MRHLSAPWYVENIPGGFVVRNADRKPVAHVYGHDGARQTEGIPGQLTINEAREMALLIAKCSEALLGKEAPQNLDQHPQAPSTGKIAKRSRTDLTSPPHSISVLHGRAKARLSARASWRKKHQNGREGGEDQRAAQ